MIKIGIRAQVDALDLIIANRRGHIENLQRLVAAKKRDKTELEVAMAPLAALEAASKTLKWVMANEKTIKSAFQRQESG